MKRKSTKKPVGCRLEEEYREALAAEASERGVEVSDVIRAYIIRGLRDEAARESLLEVLERIWSEIRETREDQTFIAEALLSGAGKFEEGEARDWIERNFPEGKSMKEER